MYSVVIWGRSRRVPKTTCKLPTLELRKISPRVKVYMLIEGYHPGSMNRYPFIPHTRRSRDL